MHTYRDAIPRARSVWALYPGNDFRFLSVEERNADIGKAAQGSGHRDADKPASARGCQLSLSSAINAGNAGAN
jgi:hypothetical protein